jgi:uncharacterized protein (TIGR03067 family)
MRRFAMVAFLALLTAVGVGAQAGLSKELTSLQGTWVLTSADGQVMDSAGGEVTLVITGDKYTQTQNGQVVERGSLKLDASKTPMWIDLIITEGDDANKTQLGVFQIQNDTLTGKLNAPGSADRPKDFVPTEGAFVFVAKKRTLRESW